MIPTSDIVSAGTVDPGGAKKDIQDSSVPATTGKRHAGATSADVSKSVKQNTCDTVETTEAETKKQRYSGDFLNVKKKKNYACFPFCCCCW